MAEYKGACTGAMLDLAGEMAMRFQNTEIGTATITVPKNTRGIFNHTVHFEKPHTDPKIFLQLNTGASTGNPLLSMQPVVTYVHDTYFYITLTATNSPDSANLKELPSGKYYVDYLIIDRE